MGKCHGEGGGQEREEVGMTECDRGANKIEVHHVHAQECHIKAWSLYNLHS